MIRHGWFGHPHAPHDAPHEHHHHHHHHELARHRRGGPPGPPPGPGGPPPPPPPGGGPFGPGGPFGGFFGHGFDGRGLRGPRRARRGNVRGAILALLGEAPANGYQIMQAIEQRSRGTWKPSSGSVYPTLQQLEDEGLIAPTPGANTYELTKAGRAHVADHADELVTDWDLSDDAHPWHGDPRFELIDLLRQLATTVHQVAQAASAKQVPEAKRILADARRRLYALLASDDGDDE